MPCLAQPFLEPKYQCNPCFAAGQLHPKDLDIFEHFLACLRFRQCWIGCPERGRKPWHCVAVHVVALARESVRQVEIWKAPLNLSQRKVDEVWGRIFTEHSLVIKSFNTYNRSKRNTISKRNEQSSDKSLNTAQQIKIAAVILLPNVIANGRWSWTSCSLAMADGQRSRHCGLPSQISAFDREAAASRTPGSRVLGILSAECWGSNFGVDLWPRSPWICTSVVLTFWQRRPWCERVVHASIHAVKCSLLLLQPHFKEDLAAGRHGSRRCFELNVAWAGAWFGVICFFWEARWRNTCRLCRQGRAKG